MQSVFNVVSVLLGLTTLGTLRLLIVLLLLGCLLRPLVLRVLLRMASSLVRSTGSTLVEGVIMGLLVICVLSGLPLVLRLLILACIGGLCLRRPLVLVFDLVTQVIILTIFRTIDALFLSVFFFTLFFAFFIVSFCSHIFHDILVHHTWTTRGMPGSCVSGWLLGRDGLLLLLTLLSLHLLFGCGLAFLLINQVMHGHYRLFTIWLSCLLILALILLSIHGSGVHIRLIPSTLLHGLHGSLFLLLRSKPIGLRRPVLDFLLLIFRSHVDYFDCLGDIKFRLDHSGVIALSEILTLRIMMGASVVVDRHGML